MHIFEPIRCQLTSQACAQQWIQQSWCRTLFIFGSLPNPSLQQVSVAGSRNYCSSPENGGIRYEVTESCSMAFRFHVLVSDLSVSVLFWLSPLPFPAVCKIGTVIRQVVDLCGTTKTLRLQIRVYLETRVSPKNCDVLSPMSFPDYGFQNKTKTNYKTLQVSGARKSHSVNYEKHRDV